MSGMQTESLEFDLPVPHAPDPLTLTAFRLVDDAGWLLQPAPVAREWMEAHDGFAKRCLPLTIANQAGWAIGCPCSFTAVWTGGLGLGDVRIYLDDPLGKYAKSITSHFGNGIITWNLPWLFRANRDDIALSVRGLPNAPKPYAAPLEGIVEIDWLPFTFTANWKITVPNAPVMFTRGEPICFLQPVSLDAIETAQPVRREISEEPELQAAYRKWLDARTRFNANGGRLPSDWQKFYHTGQLVGGAPKHHRTRLVVPQFASRNSQSAQTDSEPSRD